MSASDRGPVDVSEEKPSASEAAAACSPDRLHVSASGALKEGAFDTRPAEKPGPEGGKKQKLRSSAEECHRTNACLLAGGGLVHGQAVRPQQVVDPSQRERRDGPAAGASRFDAQRAIMGHEATKSAVSPRSERGPPAASAARSQSPQVCPRSRRGWAVPRGRLGSISAAVRSLLSCTLCAVALYNRWPHYVGDLLTGIFVARPPHCRKWRRPLRLRSSRRRRRSRRLWLTTAGGFWKRRNCRPRSSSVRDSVPRRCRLRRCNLTSIPVREGKKDLQKQYEKTEDDLKALQSVGQIIGEVLRQLDEERCTLWNRFACTRRNSDCFSGSHRQGV